MGCRGSEVQILSPRPDNVRATDRRLTSGLWPSAILQLLLSDDPNRHPSPDTPRSSLIDLAPVLEETPWPRVIASSSILTRVRRQPTFLRRPSPLGSSALTETMTARPTLWRSWNCLTRTSAGWPRGTTAIHRSWFTANIQGDQATNEQPTQCRLLGSSIVCPTTIRDHGPSITAARISASVKGASPRAHCAFMRSMWTLANNALMAVPGCM